MEIELKPDDKKRLYLKEELARILGQEEGPSPVLALGNCHTVVLYSKTKTYTEVLRSLDVLRADVLMRIDEQRKKETAPVAPA